MTVAADGMEALAAIDAALPDLVITDMHMPVIVLSAQAGEEQRAAGLRQGADPSLWQDAAP